MRQGLRFVRSEPDVRSRCVNVCTVLLSRRLPLLAYPGAGRVEYDAMRQQPVLGTKIRSCRLNKRRREYDVKQADLAWSVPVMRVGYAGRGLVYLTFAGFSLYALWRGEQPQE